MSQICYKVMGCVCVGEKSRRISPRNRPSQAPVTAKNGGVFMPTGIELNKGSSISGLDYIENNTLRGMVSSSAKDFPLTTVYQQRKRIGNPSLTKNDSYQTRAQSIHNRLACDVSAFLTIRRSNRVQMMSIIMQKSCS